MTAAPIPWLRAQIQATRTAAEAAEANTGDPTWEPGHKFMGETVVTARGAEVVAGQHGFLAWERRQHIALHDPAAALALCDSHTELLDWIESNRASDLKMTSPDQDPDQDPDQFLGSLYLGLQMHRLVGSLLTAYRHRPGYAGVLAEHQADEGAVTLSISDDELTARRDRRREEGRS